MYCRICGVWPCCSGNSCPTYPIRLQRCSLFLEARDESLVKELGLDSLQRISLDRVASERDVGFVLTPGRSEMKNLINEDFLRKMRKTSVMVNNGRIVRSWIHMHCV